MKETGKAARTRPGRSARKGWIFWGLVLALSVSSFAFRLQEVPAVAGNGGYWFWDNDTVRRLCRLDLLDRGGTYPPVNHWDGYPEGSVIHWTRPMDWVIRALDGPASLFLPRAREYEAGAALAGPLLSLLSLLVLLWAARRLLGEGPALAAGVFYAFSYSCANVSWFGNGDHQNLQHLLLLASLLLGLMALEKKAEKAPKFTALLSGALMGGAVWVSTESMLLLYLAAFLLFLLEWRASSRNERTLSLPWAAGLCALLLAGHLVEHPHRPFAFLWDQVSLFQLLQAGALLLFAALQSLRFPSRIRPFSSAGIALLMGGILLVLFFGRAFAEETARFRLVDPWLQNEVSEYRTLFTDGISFTLLPALSRFSFLLAAFPFILAGAWKAPSLSREGRFFLCAWGIFGLALASWEVKLAHLFAMAFPILLGLAAWEGPALWERRPSRLKVYRGAAFLLVAAAALTSLPTPPHRRRQVAQTEELISELCRDLRSLDEGGKKGSVLAPWDLGAKLMYYARVPVVSSGYHRNIRGILDGIRVYTARPGGEERLAREILRNRRTAYVVAYYDRRILLTAPAVLGEKVVLARSTPYGLTFTDQARRTLLWRLRYGPGIRGFTQVKESDAMVVIPPSTRPEPFYRIYRFEPE